MGINKGWDRHFFVKSVMESGRSLNIARGQFAVVDEQAAPTKDGRKVISDFAGMPKDSRVKILQGYSKLAGNRSQSSNAPWSTVPFKLSDVQDLRVDVPSTDFKTDAFVIGYDGFDDNTALTFENGDNEEIWISLEGEAIGMLGYKDARVDLKLHLEAPNTGEFTNQEIVEKAVERLKAKTLMGGVPLTQYVKIRPVDSESPETITGGTVKEFHSLTLEDNGDYAALGAVQAQYPDYEVVRSERNGDESVYTLISEADATIADYSKFKRGKLKGCESCPTGYTEYEDGFIYSITLEDDGADSTTTINGISTNASGATKISQDEGASTYTVVSSAELTDAEKDTFLGANEGATIELVSRDVAGFCSPDNQETTSWVQGESCVAVTEDYSIVLSDDECGSPITDRLNAAYEQTVTLDSSNMCQSKYSMSVTTDIVCEECSPEFRDLFISERPEPFGQSEWKKEDKTYSATAKMGILIEAKKTILAGSENYRDYMPDMATAPRLAVAGGYATTISENFSAGSTKGRFNVKVLSVGTQPENWGMNLREYEEASRKYFTGDSRQYQNEYGKWAKGEETMLDATVPYVDYVLTVRTNKLTQGFAGELPETFYYHFITEVGLHEDVEAILNKLAAEAGVAPVQAFGKTSA